MTPLARRRLWAGLFVAVIFVLGVATGASLGRFLRFGPPFGRRPPPPSPAMMADRLTKDLNLTPEQRAKLEVVLGQGAERLQRFHAETGEAYAKLRQELDADIERLLTPDQVTRFRARRPPPRDGRPRGGPPPPPR